MVRWKYAAIVSISTFDVVGWVITIDIYRQLYIKERDWVVRSWMFVFDIWIEVHFIVANLTLFDQYE